MAREIFISYSRKDLDRVIVIKREIEHSTGAECWMDLNGIETGERFKHYQILLGEIDAPEKLNEIGNELCRYNIRKYADAVKFFEKASDLGYAEAQCNLGACYEHGRGILKDYTKAIYWYSKAAEQGHRYSPV